jgi:hypothetical protein
MFVVPYILVIYMFNSGPTRCTHYCLFLSSLALRVSGAYLHPSSGAQLQRTAIGFVSVENRGLSIKWCGCIDLCVLGFQSIVWYLFAGVCVCHWICFGIVWSCCVVLLCYICAPETCRANDERNKECSVHLVGPELNIFLYILKGKDLQEIRRGSGMAQDSAKSPAFLNTTTWGSKKCQEFVELWNISFSRRPLHHGVN